MPVGPTPPLRSLLLPRYFPMSLHSLRQPPSSTPSFRRIFPFKLKYLTLNSKVGFQATRNLSTRPFNSRPKATPPLSKSLIEDEDELSDWVSGLRTSSIKSGVFTDDEEGHERGGRKKRGRESNFGSDGEERGFREVGKKGRESTFGSGGEERGFREVGKKGIQSNFSSGGEGRGFREVGKKGIQSNFSSGGVEKGFREVGKKGFRGSSNVNRDNGKGSEFGMRGGRGGGVGGRFGGERGNGVREGVKGKEREFGARNGLGGGMVSRGKPVFVSEEEEEDEFESRIEKVKGKGKENSVSGFLDLIGEDDDSEEDVDVEDSDDADDDEYVVSRSKSSLFGNEGGNLRTGTSSTEGGASYLSETRFAFSYVISCLL